MTIKELYEWAIEHYVEDEILWTDYGEGVAQIEPPIIEDFGVVV